MRYVTVVHANIFELKICAHILYDTFLQVHSFENSSAKLSFSILNGDLSIWYWYVFFPYIEIVPFKIYHSSFLFQNMVFFVSTFILLFKNPEICKCIFRFIELFVFWISVLKMLQLQQNLKIFFKFDCRLYVWLNAVCLRVYS